MSPHEGKSLKSQDHGSQVLVLSQNQSRIMGRMGSHEGPMQLGVFFVTRLSPWGPMELERVHDQDGPPILNTWFSQLAG